MSLRRASDDAAERPPDRLELDADLLARAKLAQASAFDDGDHELAALIEHFEGEREHGDLASEALPDYGRAIHALIECSTDDPRRPAAISRGRLLLRKAMRIQQEANEGVVETVDRELGNPELDEEITTALVCLREDRDLAIETTAHYAMEAGLVPGRRDFLRADRLGPRRPACSPTRHLTRTRARGAGRPAAARRTASASSRDGPDSDSDPPSRPPPRARAA